MQQRHHQSCNQGEGGQENQICETGNGNGRMF